MLTEIIYSEFAAYLVCLLVKSCDFRCLPFVDAFICLLSQINGSHLALDHVLLLQLFTLSIGTSV